MKKIIAIAIAVLTVFSFSSVAFAESTTTLTTTVPDAEYTLNIPADQEIPFGATSTDIGSISVTDSSGFAVGKNLEVTLTYEDFSCEDVSTTIPFSVNLNSTEHSVQDITIESGKKMVFDGKSDGSVRIYDIRDYYTGEYQMDVAKICVNSTDWGKALGGDYSATITFTAEVVAA